MKFTEIKKLPGKRGYKVIFGYRPLTITKTFIQAQERIAFELGRLQKRRK